MRWFFWGAVFLIAYTYLGYVGWVWLGARLWPWPVLRAHEEPYVSIVMVVRNEEQWLAGAILQKQAHNPRVQVLLNQLSRGKACGSNDAISLAAGEIVVFTDARQKPAAVVAFANFMTGRRAEWTR